jgi:hypothetical protein
MVFNDGKVFFEAGALIEIVLKKYKKEAKALIPDDWDDKQILRNNLYEFW